MRRPQVLIVLSLECTDVLGRNTLENLKAAEAFCHRYQLPIDVVVFAGGIFNRAKGQVKPAAWLMEEWWLRVFDFQHQILVEDKSLTTRQNLLNVHQMLQQNGYNLVDCDVHVVSEFWHAIGVSYLCRRLFNVRVNTIPSRFRESFHGVCGRIARLALYRVDPEGKGALSQMKIKERGG